MTDLSSDYDSPWKDILERYFEDFMAFFFPEAHKNIDWTATYIFSDKELQKVVRDAKSGRRYVDKLVRVRQKNGEKTYVMVHVEIQGQYESDFAKRMYIYNYRLFDTHDCKVASLAILTDERPKWRPRKFSYEIWGSEVSLKFPVIKLLDYKDKLDILAENDNPFAMVVMAHLQTISTRNDPVKRFTWKFNLTKMLYRREWDKQAILELYRFIDWIMVLPDEMERDFTEKITKFSEERKMRYVTNIERFGIEKGIEKGIKKGEYKIVLSLLTARFGELPEWAEKKLEQAAAKDLENWGIRLLSANNIEDVFA